MPIYGAVSINLALGLAILTIAAIVIYIRSSDYRWFLAGQRLVLSTSVLVCLSTLALVIGLMQSNFDMDYVARYTSYTTPALYKFSALWAGQAGSLLFWSFVLSIYTIVVVVQNREKHLELMPYVIAVLSVIQIFFLFLVNFISNPFEPIGVNYVIADGLGLNPLLQNPTMVIHPPMLYLGYVGFAVPYAFAIAALFSRRLDALWIRSIRRWTLFTWLTLGLGIILGGWWAYLELGWGGYWAWDPVENASFMPWLTGTAFIHSIIIQEKKNMLRVWNMILIFTTFTLCIFGTFLTRSGIVSSVHSFAASSLGPLFFGFVLFIIIFSTYLLLTRLKDLRSEVRMESFISRESGFLFNNVVFISLCFAVFWGTLFPIISEAVRGTKITVGVPFFNQITVPIGLFLLFLTGLGPLLAWKRTSKKSLYRNFFIPVIIGLIAGGLSYMFGIHSIYPLVTIGLAVFVSITIIVEFYRGIRVRTKKYKENPIIALKNIVGKNRSRYGGYIVHIGIVLMFVGFVGKSFDKEKEWTVSPGDTVELGGYNILVKNLREEERANHYAWITDLYITKNHKFVTELFPEKRIYFHTNPNPERRQPHSEIDIYSRLREDIYAVFGGIDAKKNIISLKIMVNHLVQFVWIGSYLLLIGTIIAMWPHRKEM